jgi:adenosylmethionine---8-amino-7-oxononanoate aminotransferase
MSLSSRDQAVLWHPYTQHATAAPPLGVVRAEGAWLYTEADGPVLDAISSWWVNLHGHSHPAIAERVNAQLRTLEHVIFAGFTHEPAVQLAERLLPLLPGQQARAFYSDNGSTAVEVALKMALQFHYNHKRPHRRRMVVFEGSYHGDTFGAMAVSERNHFTQPFWSLLFEVVTIPVPRPGHEAASIAALRAAVKPAPGTPDHDIAAFIFEPLLLGTSGMLTYAPEALAELLTICERSGVLTIADEVFTGFGRTGRLFASDHLSFAAPKPDIFCLSKGLTGGTMALGLTTCTSQIYNAFLSSDRTRAFFHGHSYTANPVACAAALASLDLLLAADCQRQIQAISAAHAAFAPTLRAHPAVAEVRHLGTMLAVELAAGGPTSYFHGLRDTLYQTALGRGVLLRPLGNVVYALPPYCVSPDEQAQIHTALLALADAAHALAAGSVTPPAHSHISEY